jgi:hypothetical protein
VTSALDEAVDRLAPPPPLLSPQDLRLALGAGSVAGLPEEKASRILAMFLELTPNLIVRCANEVDVPLAHTMWLYDEWLATNPERPSRWAMAVEHLL